MQSFRRHWWWMLVVCGVALGARVAILLWQGALLNQDVDAYLEIARHVAAGEGFSKDQPLHPTAYRPPLYPLLVAAVFKAGGSPICVGMIQAVLGVLTTALTLRLGQLLGLGSVAVVAALLVAIDPLLVQYTSLPMTETLCAALVAMWCWLVLEFPARRQAGDPIRFWPPLLHGAGLGLICLCRPGFLAVAGIAALWMTWHIATAWRAGGRRVVLRREVTAVLSCLIGLMLVLGPWMVRNAIVMGKATPATTHGGYTLLLANNPVFYHEVAAQPWGTVWQGPSLHRWQVDLEAQMAAAGIRPDDEVSRDRWMYRQAWSHVRAEPGLFLRACLWRAVRFWDVAPWRMPKGLSQILFWGTAGFYGLVSCGILIGLARLTRVEWITWRLLLLLPLTLWLTHLLYWTDMRMRAPVIPILAVLAARGFNLASVRRKPDGFPTAEAKSNPRNGVR